MRGVINKPESNVIVSPGAAAAIAPRKLQSFAAAAVQAVKAALSLVLSTIKVAAATFAALNIKQKTISKNI
jgi:hypothetical protein